MDDDRFEAELDTIVASTVQDLCFKPLCALTLSEPPKWVATSTTDPRYRTTIADLVNLALELTKIENVWIEMAIAQRSNAEASIDVSIRVGRKRYWRGLISDIFLGFTMRSVLEVLQKDIVNVWSMHDPEKHLKKPEFLAFVVSSGGRSIRRGYKQLPFDREGCTSNHREPGRHRHCWPHSGVCSVRRMGTRDVQED
ncbi:hypothetical protein C8J57DRAFT_730658 [Mycena rebaudengoi]|nr:hypothetical protein C8J57DRAFT_730658 [Mycena rebaudengoi]